MKKLIILLLIFYTVSNAALTFSSPIEGKRAQTGFDLTFDSIKMDCEAWFLYEPIQNYYFHFYAETSPVPADFYFWDFGDGQTGTGQDIEHLFNPALGNMFLVSLTTVTYDTIAQDSCLAYYEEEVWVNNGGGDCENFFEYSTEDNITFTFFGEAIPPAFYYEWDFGDGQTGTGQIIEHTFNPNLGNLFEVTLFTASINFGFIDTCYATSVQYVQVSNIPECQADFIYEQNPVDPYTYLFFDLSTGNIDTWEWDFGDGSYSNEQNPIHAFSETGEFIVCLSISNDSLTCSDSICMVISVEGSIEAGFTYELDSLSQIPNKYYFFDLSTGDIDNWEWDFGDGSFSNEKDPVHTFSETGVYYVCLEVTRYVPSGGVLVDSYCEVITTPDYFDFGGITYLGNLPMNNPEPSGDTGVAYLYRNYSDYVIPFDTIVFYEYGYYWFTQILQGDYIVKVKLTESSSHYSDFVPSYYGSSMFWKDAEPIMLLDSNNYLLDIHLTEIQEMQSGIGSVSGYIKVEGDCINENELLGITIILFDNNSLVVSFTETDENGYWSLNNLPFGTYSLFAEATGLSNDNIPISLDELNYIQDNVELTVKCDNSIGYPEYTDSQISVGDIYPNPVTEQFNLDIEANEKTELILCIYSITGQQISKKEFLLKSGLNTITANISSLPCGSYLLSVYSKNKKSYAYRKFVR